MKRIIAVGRIDRRAQKSTIVVVDGGFILTEWRDGNVKKGWQRPITEHHDRKEPDGP